MPKLKDLISGARYGQIENFKSLKSSTGNGEVIYLRIRGEKMLFMAEKILEPAAQGVTFRRFYFGMLPT